MHAWKSLFAGAVAWLIIFGISNGGQCSQVMIASYYWQPQALASGGQFNPHGLSAAHRSLPFGTKLRVCLHGCVVVTVNDRGPFIKGRTLDLSLASAKVIGLTQHGVATVQVEIIR